MPEILVVDDNRDLRKLVDTILSEEGYRVHQASSGKEALLYLHSGVSVDLVLLDIAMEPMDGFATMAQMTQSLESERMPKVCFLSAIQSKDYVLRALKIGGDDYIVKPVDRSVLVSKVRSLIGENVSEDDFIQMDVAIPAYLDQGLLITAISEYGLTFQCREEVSPGAKIQLFCPEFQKPAGQEVKLNMVRVSRVEKQGSSFLVRAEFVGISEGTKRLIRSMAIKRRSLAKI